MLAVACRSAERVLKEFVQRDVPAYPAGFHDVQRLVLRRAYQPRLDVVPALEILLLYQRQERLHYDVLSLLAAFHDIQGDTVDHVRVFIEHNDNFRLPANPETPVIMIGPGTGIAPFRAFMQQRAADEAPGKNWLFFGNPHFTEDFLYQVEWQRYVKDGVLTRIDLAWSRDQKEKVYVQDKLREQGAELWRWINDGAHIYVCGDANRMAKDVEQALLEVIAEFGGMDTEAADEFLSELRVERRYQRDVY